MAGHLHAGLLHFEHPALHRALRPHLGCGAQRDRKPCGRAKRQMIRAGGPDRLHDGNHFGLADLREVKRVVAASAELGAAFASVGPSVSTI